MKNVDQGTILYGFRSQKYPEIPSYAVIISARCDIAQNKINKLYYLSAVDANQWFCTSHGFHCALENHISSCHGNLKTNVSKYGINVELLKTFEKENAYAVLSSIIPDKELNKVKASYDELYDLIKPDSNFVSRRAFFLVGKRRKKQD